MWVRYAVEHEVLEREVGRLRALYQQQQQPQPQPSHRRAKSSDLDQQFANLSLKHKEASGGHIQVSGQRHIWVYSQSFNWALTDSSVDGASRFPLFGRIKPDSSSACALPHPALFTLLYCLNFLSVGFVEVIFSDKLVSPCAPSSLC